MFNSTNHIDFERQENGSSWNQTNVTSPVGIPIPLEGATGLPPVRNSGQDWGLLQRNITVFYALLIIQTILGIFGNTVSLAVLSRKAFRGTSSSVYLRALAVIDSMILVGYNITIQPLSNKLLCSTKASCYITLYFGVTFVDTVEWILVLFTCERLIAVIRPFAAKRWLNVQRACTALVITFLLLSVINTYHFWFMDRNMCIGCVVFYPQGDVSLNVTRILSSTKRVFIPLPFMAVCSVIIVVQTKREKRKVLPSTFGNAGIGDNSAKGNQKSDRTRSATNLPTTIEQDNSGDTSSNTKQQDNVEDTSNDTKDDSFTFTRKQNNFKNLADDNKSCSIESQKDLNDEKKRAKEHPHEVVPSKSLSDKAKPVFNSRNVKKTSSGRDRAMVVTLVSLNVVSIITITPHEVHAFATEGQSSPQILLVKYTLLVIFAINHTINMFLYAATGSKFRSECVAMFKDVKGWCKRR